MRATSSIYLLGVMLSGVVALAAEPTGPRTLENVLAAAEDESQAAVVADDAADEKEATEPPTVRKNDPLQQRLDAALAEYNPAIEMAIDELAKEIEEEFNKATKKGDIQLARKCKAAEATLRERGLPPSADFLKMAKENAQRKITRASGKLSEEYEAVAKECLKAGDLNRAESVLSEKADLLAEMKAWKVAKPLRQPVPPGAAVPAATKVPVVIELVPVSNPGNQPDVTGHGGVDYEYRIGRYEVTVAQYVAFLNSVGKSDPRKLFNPNMENGKTLSQIGRKGGEGNWVYRFKGGKGEDRCPVVGVTWRSAARFVNWLHNGQGDGSTETGAYDLENAQDDEPIVRSSAARFFLPTEDEWYKAAYYDPKKADGSGYWRFANRSDEITGPDRPYGEGLKPVGSYKLSRSYYGCYDMSASLEEWLERHGLRGGNCWMSTTAHFSSEHRGEGGAGLGPETSHNGIGFRVAAPIDNE